jgi:hypothetical protein
MGEEDSTPSLGAATELLRPEGLMTDHIICGWRVRTALPLPEAAPWRGPDRPVDVEIRAGPVPAKSDKHAYIESVPDGRLLLDLSPDVRFLVAPNCIVVDTSHPPESVQWRVRFLGPVLGLLCYLRGVVPLHACSVRIGTRTIAIAGRSCAGKSTIAAALMRRNHTLVTDDICAITSISGRPIVLPSFPALKLAADSLHTLGFEPQGLAQVWLDTEKFLLPGNEGFDPTPSPLKMVYLLEEALDGMDHTIIPVNGTEAFEQLGALWYRAEIGRFLYDKATLFSMAARIVNQVGVRRLVRPLGFARLPALVKLIEADAARD